MVEKPKAAAVEPAKPRPKVVAADTSVAPSIQTEVENTTESIWEQLLDAPPSRGRSMSTVVLKDTKVLLSSWEVAAFLSEGGQDSADIRRAVVARALLAVAIDVRKRSGESDSLESALTLARSEVSYFQGRVEESKRAKNTEACRQSGNQHEAAALIYRGSGLVAALVPQGRLNHDSAHAAHDFG